MLNTMAALLAFSSPPTGRPKLLKTFNASQYGYSWATGAMNASVTGQVIFSEARLSQIQDQWLPDGRSTHVVFEYTNDTGGVYSLQPFFDERICMLYPLPQGYPGQPESFDLALEEAWCQQAAPCLAEYELSTLVGPAIVGGSECQLWRYQATGDQIDFCVTSAGALLGLNRSYANGNVRVEARLTLTNFSTNVDAKAFAVPNKTECVDLRPSKATRDDPSAPVNDAARIARANAEAGGAWVAEASPVFEGLSQVDAAARSFGLRALGVLELPPPTAEHLAGVAAATPAQLPLAFDAREAWGTQCASVMAVRNQGACGG